MNPYESDKLLHEYLLFHYGSPEEVMPWPQGPRDATDYAVRCVSECLDLSVLPSNARALEVGCAVGRSSFELARHCTEVVGIDFSSRFIDAAREIAASGSMQYTRVEEGVLVSTASAQVPEGVDPSRVRFERGDAHALPADDGEFDVVLAANLIDRLHTPRLFLAQLPRLLRRGGQLIITSPYTWLSEYTPAEEWLGGTLEMGQTRQTLDGLKRALESEFILLRTADLPFVIREHARKFQWSVAQASIWRRR